MKLWLLASQLGHPLPNNPKFLAGKIGTTGRFHLAAIIAAGFIYETDDSASEDASKNAGPSASTTASADASKSGAESYALARADAPSRQRTEDRVQSSETTPPSSSESKTAASARPAGVVLVAAANRAIAQRWGEQPNPIRWDAGTTIEAVDTLRTAGVPTDFAADTIAAWCATAKKDRPPGTLNYFAKLVVERWQAAQAYVDAHANGANGNGSRPLTEQEALKAWAAAEEKAHA
jgi:hypothetical protein